MSGDSIVTPPAVTQLLQSPWKNVGYVYMDNLVDSRFVSTK
jgi:hypothetical protein